MEPACVENDPIDAAVPKEFEEHAFFPALIVVIGVANFDGIVKVCRQDFTEVLEFGKFRKGEPGMQLNMKGSQLGCDPIKPLYKGEYIGVCVFQTFVMRNRLWKFEAEFEFVRYLCPPVLYRIGGGYAVECGVTFHSIEDSGVLGQKTFGRGSFPVKFSDPLLEAPLGATNMNVFDAHRF